MTDEPPDRGAPPAGRPHATDPSAPPPPTEAERRPTLPSAWGGAHGGPKHWRDGARSDDPSARTVHAPLDAGIGSGKAFFFLFGLKRSSEVDRGMLDRETARIADDIEVLRRAGYAVVVDPQATREDFLATVAGRGEGAEGLVPAGFYWSAHGFEDGSIECFDGGRVMPSDVDAATVSAGLRLAIFGACYVGSRSRTWRAALGGRPLVVGWGQPVTIDRCVDFLDPDPDTETDLDDLIRRYLLTDAPLPGEPDAAFSPLAESAARGRIAGLPDRVRRVAGMLGARWREEVKWIDVEVPLEGRRTHFAKVFVVDSTEPFSEGEPLLAVEAEVGELSAIVDPPMLLSGVLGTGYARVALVRGETDMPRIVAQGYMPLARVRDQDLAAVVYQVAACADELERRIFGGDMR